MIAFVLALHLLAATPVAVPDAGPTPVATGAPRFAQLGTLTGVPPDSSMRTEFLSGFRSAFASDELPGERLSYGDEWKPGLPLPNHFRLLEGTPADDAWSVDVMIGSPPPLRTPDTQKRSSRTVPTRRASRGMIIAFVIQVPDPAGGAPSTLRARYAFAFPATTPLPGDLVVPASGYVYPWAQAGRLAGALALEVLQRESGDITAAERMDIQPAVRMDAGR